MYDPTKPYKKQILKLISKTWETPYISVKKGIYPIFRRKFNYLEVDHTDGIGSKGEYHWQKRTLKNAVIDALAMNLNDLALVRATPFKMQNHIVLEKDDHEAILEIISVMSKECRKYKIAMTGGETSIQQNTSGMDISMTVSGFIKKEKPNQIQAGDVLIGFASNGIHSNGFTKIHEIFGQEFRDEFTIPTRVYLDQILEIDAKHGISGMMHMTGGSYSKLKDIISNVDIEIENDHKLKPQAIFKEIYKKGVSDQEMYKTFNCGIGFIISVSQKAAGQIIKEYPNIADIIGRAKIGRGNVFVKSLFSHKIIKM